MSCRWMEMIEQRDVDLCEKSVDVLIGEPEVNQKLHHEEKKADAEINEEEKKTGEINYGFISYFKEAVQKIKESDEKACITKEIRKEIGLAFKNLPTDKKRKYTVGRHRGVRLNGERPKFVSRCVPERLASIVSKLTAEQRAAVCSIGFGQLLEMKCGRLKRKLCEWLLDRVDIARSVLCVNGQEVELSAESFGQIMGISDGGMHVEIDGNMKEVCGYFERFEATSRGINIKKLEEILSRLHCDEDEFKVAFTLFALYSVLCPPGGVHINSEFLFSLKDVKAINLRNWASFCFGRLMDGITRYKEEKLAYVGGCLLYLQVLYINSVVYGRCRKDKSLCPVVRWDAYEISRFMKWLDKQGGIGTDKVALRGSLMEGCRSVKEQGENYQLLNTEQKSYSNGIEIGLWPEEVHSNVADLKEMTDEMVGEIKGVEGSALESGQRTDKNFEAIEMGESNREIVAAIMLRGDGSAKKSKRLRKEGIGEEHVSSDKYDILGKKEQQIAMPLLRKLEDKMDHTTKVSSLVTSPAKYYADLLVGLANRQVNLANETECRGIARFRAGPFVVHFPVCDLHIKLIEYMMNDDLDQSEYIVITKMNWLSRKEMLSLCPKRWIHGSIISVVAESLAMNEQAKGPQSPQRWFLPTYFAQKVLVQGSDVSWLGTWKGLRACYMQDLSRCHQIYIPMNHEELHWYVVVVNIRTRCAEIWDPLHSSSNENSLYEEAKTMMRALDAVLQDDIKMLYGSEFSFKSFTIAHNKGMHKQHNSYDCGLFVIWYMQNVGKEWDLEAYKYDSDEARKNLAIELVMCCGNLVKDKILECSHRFNVMNELEKCKRAKLFEQKYLAQGRRSKRKGHGRRK